LGAVWDEVLLELGEIVEVTREDESRDMCGAVLMPIVTVLGNTSQEVNEKFG